MKKYDNSSKKLDRKTVEKNRRIQMKGLCYKLNSLIPLSFYQPHKLSTQEDRFDQSILYIEQLKKNIEVLKNKKDEALKLVSNDSIDDASNCNVRDRQLEISQVTIDVKELDDGLQVFLTTKLQRRFSFSSIINIVEDGGAEVLKAGYTTVGDKFIYTLHAKARISRIGVDITGVRKQLQELINRS